MEVCGKIPLCLKIRMAKVGKISKEAGERGCNPGNATRPFGTYVCGR